MELNDFPSREQNKITELKSASWAPPPPPRNPPVVLPSRPSTSHESLSPGVSDETRFAIIDAVYLRPSLWDPSQEQKASGPARKELFRDITALINQQTGSNLACEEVEKLWKNLKDTFHKCRRKLTYTVDGSTLAPKWKFYGSMTFLDEVPREETNLQAHKRRHDGSLLLKADDGEDDEYMGFCKSLVYSLREIGSKDRVQLLKVQKAIRDLVHDAQMEALVGSRHL